MQVTGTIDSIRKVSKTSKAGKPFSLYYADVDGFNDPVCLGFKIPPNVSEGKNVDWDVEFEYNEYKYKGATGTVISKGSPPASKRQPTMDFPVPFTDKGQSICRQSALKAAVELHAALIASGAMLWDVTKMEGLTNSVIDMAYDLTDFSTGQREVKISEGTIPNKAED